MMVEKQVFNKRKTCEYRDLSQPFYLTSKNYTKQYSNIYSARITQARKILQKRSKEKWGISANTLTSLNTNKDSKCAVLGTIYKKQELKPSILQEVSKQYETVAPPTRTHFTSDSDELILEDETQRVILTGELDVHSLVTGCVVAVLGKLHENGIFVVEDVCWPKTEASLEKITPIMEDRYMVIICGLELATSASVLFPLQLFVDWITGNIEEDMQINVVHVLIAGNCIRKEAQEKPKYGATIDYSPDIEAVKQLDDLLEQLAESVDVDIMPGEFDPTNHALPQQPFHRCMFPKASAFTTLRPATNPHVFELDGHIITGTSGEPIVDIQRYSNITDPMEVLEKTLEWGHLAPTAPDTIPCYPFKDTDPFLLKHTPNVYFAANQYKFQTKLKQTESGGSVRLVCVPSFAKDQECVIINLKNMNCSKISFKCAH